LSAKQLRPLKPPLQGFLKKLHKSLVRKSPPAPHIEGGCLPAQGIRKFCPELSGARQGLSQKYRVGIATEALGSLNSIPPETRLGHPAIPFPKGPIGAGPTEELGGILYCLTGGWGSRDPQAPLRRDDLPPPAGKAGGVKKSSGSPSYREGSFKFPLTIQGLLLRIIRIFLYNSKQKLL